MKLAVFSFNILFFLSNSVESYKEQAIFDYKCFLCKYSGDLIIDYHDKGARPTSLFNIITTICTYLKIEDRAICKGMINNIGEQLFAILDVANGTISARDICGMV